MRFSKMLAVCAILFALALSACAGKNNAPVPQTGQTSPINTPEAMMTTPTGEMMSTPTGEAMMATDTPEAMMSTPTGEAMMATGTPEAMLTTPTGEAMMTTGTPEAMMSTPTGEAMVATGTPAAGMMEAPAWFSAPLTDVLTGKTFTINDFKGKVVVVQSLAAGCASCQQQGQQIKALRQMLGSSSNVVFVGLDVNPSESAATLKKPVEMNGFDWNNAVVSKDVASELGKLYGATFLDPASAPLLIIDTHGVVHPLPSGIQNADALKKAIEMYSGM